MDAALRSVASAKWQVAITIAVVAAFLLATTIAQLVESANEQNLDDIIGNAMPSVQALSHVRGELRRIESELPALASGSVDAAARVAEYRRNIDAGIETYRVLPYFPGERELFAAIPSRLRALDDQLARIPGHPGEIDAAHRLTDALDVALERNVTFDAAQGQRLGLELAQTRSESRLVVWTLDVASVALALGALALAVRQRRRAIRVLEEQHASAEERLDDLARQVDELGSFAGRVAHDIRSPLQSAVLAIDVARSDPTHASAPRALERGAAALARMRLLVDGLLAFARAGGRPDGDVACDACEVIASVVDGVAADAKAAAVELSFTPVPGARVLASAGILTSIVSNLVRNALRHMGDALERRIEIRLARAGVRWRCEVEDTGPGIPPGEERRIFLPHVKLSGSGSGIGLGLATVDRLVHAHGGVVGVTSPHGHGALFWFELPAV